MTKQASRSSRPSRSPTEAEPAVLAEAVWARIAAVFTPEAIDEMRAATGYNPRQRRATARRLLLAGIEAFLCGETLGFAAIRAFFERRFGAIRPRAFQLRFKSQQAVAFFKAALDRLVAEVLTHAGVRLDGPLSVFEDVLLYDGTGQRVPKRGRELLPACAKGLAGAKWVVGYSLKTGLIDDAVVKPETASELPTWRQMVPSMRKKVLYILDLGFFDRGLFAQAQHDGAHVLMRLKSNVKIKVTGNLTSRGVAELPGWSLRYYLTAASRAKGTTYDLDVLVGHGKNSLELRLVGVSLGGKQGLRWYLTTVPREVMDAADVMAAYRLRWLIEFLFRELKQNSDIGRSHTADPSALAALTYIAFIGHVLVRSLRIVAAIKEQVPLEQLRPLACLKVVRAHARDLVDAVQHHSRRAWRDAIGPLLNHVARFAIEVRPSRSRPRIALQLGAPGG